MPQTLLVEFTTDDASDATPTWVDVTTDVRAFNTSRGRDSELSRVETGTASILLNNRSRSYDPTNDPLIRPMNRWRITETITGEMLFLGYATAYTMAWPSKSGVDAVTTVALADEMMVLALDKLPTTDPPRNTYQELVLYDNPACYWPLGLDLQENTLEQPARGPQLTGAGSTVIGGGLVFGDSAIIGSEPGGHTYLTSDGYWRTEPIGTGHELDPGGLAEFSVELWLKLSGGLPGSAESLVRGPTAGSSTWSVELRTDGKIDVNARNSGGTVHTVTSTTALSNGGPWYHIVAAITGGSLRVYINGTQEDTEAWTGRFAAVSTASVVTLGNNGADISTRVRYVDELAWYRFGLPADRVSAHYTAGVSRGFDRGEDPGDRIDNIITASTSIAASSTQTGTRGMVGEYMHGQPPLEAIRRAETAENVDAVFFIARDGTITFLADGHRSSSPYNTVQMTFDDDGTDHEYTEITMDGSDSFLANEVNATREGGTLYTVSDATSISNNLTRPLAVSSLPIVLDTDVEEIADALLAKYKDMLTRVTSLTTTTAVQATATAVLALDIGDRIRVFRTQPNGGRIDQTLFVQRIEVSGEPVKPWVVRLGVSPL